MNAASRKLAILILAGTAVVTACGGEMRSRSSEIPVQVSPPQNPAATEIPNTSDSNGTINPPDSAPSPSPSPITDQSADQSAVQSASPDPSVSPSPVPSESPSPDPSVNPSPVPSASPSSKPTQPPGGSIPVGEFKVCNTTTDGCICKAADNCTTNGITYNSHKPPAGSNKVILYFHGNNGSSSLCDSNRTNEINSFLKNMYRATSGAEKGFGWICADSSDRVEKWWSTVNSSSNPDVVNLEKILAKEGYNETSQIYMIGHSNGGGFVSQMNTYTRLKNIRAVALAHSAAAGGGGKSEVCTTGWVTPTFITGSSKDGIVDWDDLVRMFDCLQAKGVPTQLDNDTALQPAGKRDHAFLDRSELIAPFWFKH